MKINPNKHSLEIGDVYWRHMFLIWFKEPSWEDSSYVSYPDEPFIERVVYDGGEIDYGMLNFTDKLEAVASLLEDINETHNLVSEWKTKRTLNPKSEEDYQKVMRDSADILNGLADFKEKVKGFLPPIWRVV